MKKATRAALLMLLSLPSVVIADPLDIAVLEEPGTIWVRDRLPDAVGLGFALPVFSVVWFEDGRLFDGFSTNFPTFPDESCDEPTSCFRLSRAAILQEADYSITADTIAVVNRTPANAVTDVVGSELVLLASSFLGTAPTLTASIDDGVLVVRKADGNWRYIPWQKDDFETGMALADFLQLRLNEPPLLMSEYGECILNGHRARLSIAETGQSARERALLSLAKVAIEVRGLEDSHDEQTLFGTRDTYGISEAEKDQFIVTLLLRGSITSAAERLAAQAASATDWRSDATELERAWAALQSELKTPDHLGPEGRQILERDFKAVLPDIHKAAPAIAELVKAAEDSTQIRSILCPEDR